MLHRRIGLTLGIFVAGLLANPALALQVQKLSPQGVVNEVRQVVLRTDQDAVRFGDPQAAAPARVSCSVPQSARGTGRWNSAREWVWQFERTVPAGVRCQVQLEKSFQSPEKAPLTGADSYQFEVAGPHVQQILPDTYQPIDEEQVFVLRFNAAPTKESLLEHSYCRSKDVGERIPLRWVEGQDAAAILDGLRLKNAVEKAPGEWALLACNRRLTAGSEVQLVYGAGVQTAGGVVNRKTRVFQFEVRSAFTAEMTCERENAQSGCLPIRPVYLGFSAQIEKTVAAQVRLVGGGSALAPRFEEDDEGNTVTRLAFGPYLQPETSYRLELPDNFADDSGRPLSNAASFPLTVKTGTAPALAKFASDEFGVLERFAEERDGDGTAVLPLTVRHIEGLDKRDATAQLRDLVLTEDAAIIEWWNKLQRYRWGSVRREVAARDVQGPLPAPMKPRPRTNEEDEADYREVDEYSVSTRSISLLQGQKQVQQVLLPAPKEGDPRPFEVIGVPLKQPGFHVLEIDSPNLGAALLDERLGAQRRMFVRTTALVTNLAVHAKFGRENAAVWVTSLDKGQPVAGAQVQVSSCDGHVQAQGLTDSQGILLLPDIAREAPRCSQSAQSRTWFVSARQDGDMAFIWSDWQRGIEPWRFNLPRSWDDEAPVVAHTVLDRTLVRAGETVSMKHFIRRERMEGLVGVKAPPVFEAVVTHVGSGQTYTLPLEWSEEGGYARYALSRFAVPPAAKLGQYRIELRWDDEGRAMALSSGQFRVEAFRLPVLEGSIQPVPKAPLVQPQALPVAVSLQYLNGGSAKGQEVKVNALLRSRGVYFPRWSRYSFAAPNGAATKQERLLADKLPVTLDAQGQGQVQLPSAGPVQQPRELLLEANFADPNGEIQTLRSTHTLWPAAVLPGILADSWVSVQRKLKLQTVAVDTEGRPQAGVAMKVEAVLTRTTTTRKRLVGGFYSYDNQTERTVLGQLCSGKSDSAGLLYCEADLTQPGQVELIVTTQDKDGNVAQAADTVWVTGQGELWFGGEDHDRMDVLPENPSYAAGQTARFQVRMPFREATALVSVEREGVLHAEVVQIKGSKPVVELPVQAGWGPNVYVSVLALRGRLYEVPWYSFFTWGYKAPRQWWDAYWNGNKEYAAPTAMVDLSKPAFRLGVAEIQVQDAGKQLQVKVSTDKPRYQVREQAQVSIQVLDADGQPAAHAQVALAAVDKALLELMPNTSWKLAEGLWRHRSWSVGTATAQSEIVGRRHYGRKAAAPGGGGGRSTTRELFDTLLLWQPVVQLDAQGRAQVTVPLNDALSSFEIVAIADEGSDRFGTGSATIATTQDLQLISGLPPVVREGDQFTALFTVRNTTGQAMQVQIKPQVSSLELSAQKVEVAAGDAKTVQWAVQVPTALAQAHEGVLHWSLQASDAKTGARDAVAVSQRLLPAVPLAVQQATLEQIDGRVQMPVQWPPQAVVGKGGLRLTFSER
ncbi:MAG: alpha-2-macroglobulin, partial [Comamonas sp.]|nr:alpha-2-macroglobulin [Comamonas sp.]